MSEEKEYKNIFKTTFLFGSVKIIQTILGVFRNKVVAILIGPEGMGMIGIFNSAIGLIQTFAGLGISQSAVRDISEANNANDRPSFSETIIVTKKIILFTGLLGGGATIVLSPFLSKWTMGSYNFTFAYCFLSLAIFFQIISNGQIAILQGMRQLKSLAKASLWGAIIGCIISIPIFAFLKKDGIVLSLILVAITSFFFSNIFVYRIDYDRIRLSLKEIFRNSSMMVKMGIGLMISNSLINLSSLIISSYIRNKGGLETVGFYSAGTILLQSYFGIIINALSTDYYPRIAAVNRDNEKLQQELNRQSSVSLILCAPLLVLFLFLMPFFVEILFSAKFYPTVDFLKFAIFGTLITICSNQVDMILIAKFNVKLFLTISILFRMVQVAMALLLFSHFGLIGVGLSMTVMGMIHAVVMITVVYKLYKINFNRLFLFLFLCTGGVCVLAILFSSIENLWLKYASGSILFITALCFSFYISKEYFKINLIEFVRKKK